MQTNYTTDSEIISLWLNQQTESTAIQYKRQVQLFVKLLDKPLKELKLEDLNNWKQDLNKYRTSTKINKIGTIKSLFKFCYKIGYLNSDLGTFIKTPKAKNELNSKILSEEDIQLLIKSAYSPRNQILIKILYGLGIRASEACNLKWSDLNREILTVYGKRAKTRHIKMPPNLVEDLKSIKTNSIYIFPSPLGKPMSRINIYRIITQTAKKANIKTSPHCLRHSHASHSLKNGASIRLVQRTLGHSSIITTEKYLHINPNESSSSFLKF